MKGQSILFSKASDEWETPQALFDELNAEFRFDLDAAARVQNTKCCQYLGPGSSLAEDALSVRWSQHGQRVWCNPPYSQVAAFMSKAFWSGVLVVMLVPSRTDTHWFHEFVWDRKHHRPLPCVEVRFLKGRLKFGTPDGSRSQSAPFPSMLVVMRPS